MASTPFDGVYCRPVERQELRKIRYPGARRHSKNKQYTRMRHFRKKIRKFSLQRGPARMFFRAPLWLSASLAYCRPNALPVLFAHWSVCQKLNHVSSVQFSSVRLLCTRGHVQIWETRNKREWVENDPLYADVCSVSRNQHYVALLRKHDLGHRCASLLGYLHQQWRSQKCILGALSPFPQSSVPFSSCFLSFPPFLLFRLRLPVFSFLFTRESSYAFSASQPLQFCLSVRLSVTRVDQAKRSKLGSPNLHHRLPGRLQFQEP